MEKNKYSEEYFLTLREFIKAAGMTYAEFADLAGINRSTFQTMMSRKSEPNFRHRKQISEAVHSKLAHEPEDSAVSRASRRFHTATMKLLTGMILSEEDNATEISTAAAASPDRERLDAAFDQLNANGQKIAAERVEELTKIPEYREEKE